MLFDEGFCFFEFTVDVELLEGLLEFSAFAAVDFIRRVIAEDAGGDVFEAPVVAALGGEWDVGVTGDLKVAHGAACPCVAEVGGVGDHVAFEDDGFGVFAGAATVVFADDEVVCGGGVELSVLVCDAEAFDGASVIYGAD